MYKEIAEILRTAKCGVTISGAGLSVASGLPTYRGEDGIWLGADMAMLTEISLCGDPQAFWQFFRRHWLSLSDAKPNAAHHALARLQQLGIVTTHLTQNVDGLLQQAGCADVVEVHGSLGRVRCRDCDLHFVMAGADADVPRCLCGGLLRPCVVMYSDPVSDEALDAVERTVASADVLLIVGTSLQVDPFAAMIDMARSFGTPVVVVDPNPPAVSGDKVIYCREAADIALPMIIDHLQAGR